MEQWSILSNIVNYVKYDRHPKNYILRWIEIELDATNVGNMIILLRTVKLFK